MAALPSMLAWPLLLQEIVHKSLRDFLHIPPTMGVTDFLSGKVEWARVMRWCENG